MIPLLICHELKAHGSLKLATAFFLHLFPPTMEKFPLSGACCPLTLLFIKMAKTLLVLYAYQLTEYNQERMSFCFYLVSNFWSVIMEWESLSQVKEFSNHLRYREHLERVWGGVTEDSPSHTRHKTDCQGKSDLAAFEWKVWSGARKPALPCPSFPISLKWPSERYIQNEGPSQY